MPAALPGTVWHPRFKIGTMSQRSDPWRRRWRLLTSCERLHLDSFEEIRRSRHFEVFSLGRLEERLRPPIGDDLGEYCPEWKTVPLFEELRFPQFYIHWHTSGALPRVYGEVDVFPLLDVAEEGEHPDPAYYQRRTELQRRFLSELRCMAGSRGSGNGHLTYLRVQPDARSIEIWFEDQRDFDSEPYPEGFVRLDLTYREYLDALLITKGARGWEYLFADVALGKPGSHDIVANLRNMLEAFPGLFPAHDYTPLGERLAARL